MRKFFLLFIFLVFNSQLFAYKIRSMITYYFNQDGICMQTMQMALRKNNYTFEIQQKFGLDWSLYENNKKVAEVSLIEPNMFRKAWQFAFDSDTITVLFADYKIEYDLTLKTGKNYYDILNLSRKCHNSFDLYPAGSTTYKKPAVIGNDISPCEAGNWEFIIKDKKLPERVIACFMFAACIAEELVRIKAQKEY